MKPRLTHVDAGGQARMVDVSAKPITTREARARGSIRMSAQALAAIVAGNLPKGDVITTARLAGIMAAKRTSELIPMCHPLLLTDVQVECEPDQQLPGIQIRSLIRCDGKTGAEMEALTAVAVAALTIIDMAKSVDRWMSIEGVTLLEKRGGKSGTQRRPTSR
ncbi:MAG TPA: cyclic pyranopterin monophosphate synthase MoaC [Candidatus Dormibacteraeota bacterium]